MSASSLSERARPHAAPGSRGPEAGFTLLEISVSMVVLMIGLMTLSAAIGYALSISNRGGKVTNTKLMIVSILEQMETLRNTKQLTFGQISNEGQVDNTGAERPFAGFPTTFAPVSTEPGPDGLFGTGDDLINAGPDGVYGTEDDFTDNSLARDGYSRKITITPLSDNLKRIEVTLTFAGSHGKVETMSGVGYLNNDARANFVP